ncbi:fibronectin type III domain-containing protein [Micromonospora fluostatini]|uniref:fibronectin type III domain-containing protein n=1 Tax=Micromonospora sp. JCM 30529 TaxID=3421643 RepID=UPI003D17096F
MSVGRWGRLLVAAPVSVALTVTALVVTAVPAVASTVLFDQPFTSNTASGQGTVAVPGVPSGLTSNSACLSAAGNTTTGPLLSCPSSTDPQGSGKLRLTPAALTRQGGVFGAVSVPTSQGLYVTFNAYQYGGSSPGADGLAFVLAAVDPADPRSPSAIGQPGGSLGYSAAYSGGSVGLSNGYLGIGFDVYGNFSNSVYQGTGCTNPAYISTTNGRVPGQVVIRGPGRNGVGYCAVNSTATSTSSSAVPLRASTRAASVVPVEVVANTTASSYTTSTGITVPAGRYAVRFTPVGGTARTLTGALPVVPSSLYPSPNWLNANGIPRQLAFGWVGSTGAVTDFHEIDNARVVSFNDVPNLLVSQTSSVGANPQPGDPVTYTVTARVDSGTSESSPVLVTQTLPAGVVPRGAYGSGWTCAAPSGQSITCTNANTPFPGGTSLPPVTVAATVTGTGVTPTLIQTGTVATASSNDASPGYAASTTAVTPATAPSAVTVTPATGSVAGGAAVTVRGTNLAGATAITIGTAAEQATGASVVLLPCASGPAAGCFTSGDGSLAVSSMPARSGPAPVTVSVVTRGAAGAGSFVYASSPAAPATPTAVAGVASATVTWAAPADNGSPITGYVITPVRDGVTQPTVSVDASTTTRTLTGLTTSAQYTFRVAAVNAYGTGTASPASAPVVPYTVPEAPTITSVTAGTTSATVTWSAPATGGSAITGYRLTPYLAGTAQTPLALPATPTSRTVTGLTAGATYTFRVAAVNAAGTGPDSAASAPVTVNAPPGLTFPPPPAGEVGAAYQVTLTVTGGTAPFVWSVSAGALPPGLTLGAATGVLAGTPTQAGSYPFTVRVTDASGFSDTRPATVTIATAPTLDFPPPPPGKAFQPYSYQLTVSGGSGPFAWSVSAGALPPGLALGAATGLLSGTPTAAGTFAFTVRVTDSFARSATRPVSLVVDPLGGLTISVPVAASLGRGTPGSPPVADRLGLVRVVDDRGLTAGSWSATVSATAFVTGSGSAGETIPRSAVRYASGPPVSTTGTGTFLPQPGTVLDVPRTAAGWSGQAGGANAVSWNPTLSVLLPPQAVVGTYRATVTHSVI